MEIKMKSWITMAVLAVFVVFSSGCAGVTQAAPRVQESLGENVAALTEDPLLSLSQLAAQGDALLHFDPLPAQVTVGGVTAVQLRLENADNLYGIEVHLTFDASVVQIEDDDPSRDGVQIAVGEMPYPEFIVQNMVDNMGGRLDYAVVQLAPRPPASGNGVVATIHFRGVGTGTSPIHFTGAKLASPSGLGIPVTLQDGTLQVTGTPTGPTQTPSPTPSSPQPTITPTQPPQPTATHPPTAPPTAGGCQKLYLVRSGDTAFSIARRFGVSLNTLAATNGLSSSYYIQIGQLLTIPGAAGPTTTHYVVQKGETLYSIARRYGSSVETLAAINRIPYPWHVRQGQTLLLCSQ